MSCRSQSGWLGLVCYQRVSGSQQRGNPDNEAAGMYSDVTYALGFGLSGAILFLLVDKYEKNAVVGNLLKFSVLAVSGLAILHKLLSFNWF